MCTHRTLSPAPDIHNTIFVTTVLADVIAPCDARPSTATLMTTKLYMFSGKFLRMSVISNRVCWQADVIQTGPRNLEKSHGASRVTALQTGNITFSAVNMTIRNLKPTKNPTHYNDVIMSVISSQITSLTVVYSIVYSDADQSKHQSSASLAFVWGIHRDRWIPRTKGQLRGKCFHLMTSSWLCHNHIFICPVYQSKPSQHGYCRCNGTCQKWCGPAIS